MDYRSDAQEAGKLLCVYCPSLSDLIDDALLVCICELLMCESMKFITSFAMAFILLIPFVGIFLFEEDFRAEDRYVHSMVYVEPGGYFEFIFGIGEILCQL